MYSEVHTIAGATLCWSGVEAQCFPVAIMAQCILGEPSHYWEVSGSMRGPLSVVTEPVQIVWGNIHKLNRMQFLFLV